MKKNRAIELKVRKKRGKINLKLKKKAGKDNDEEAVIYKSRMG